MQLIGHRGARGEYPENTLAGFQYLRDLGIRAVEFDVHQLDDGELVVFHDTDLARLCGQPGTLKSLTLAQRQQLNVASQWADLPAQPLPLLSDVWPYFTDFAHIEVELKPVTDMTAAERLIECLRIALPDWSTLVLTSFDNRILQVAQARLPQVRRGLLIEKPDTVESWIKQADSVGARHLGLRFDLVDQAQAQQLADAGLWVSLWTVNNLAQIRERLSWPISGIITDYPAQVIQAGLMTAAR